jgi:hypothetical protein
MWGVMGPGTTPFRTNFFSTLFSSTLQAHCPPRLSPALQAHSPAPHIRTSADASPPSVHPRTRRMKASRQHASCRPRQTRSPRPTLTVLTPTHPPPSWGPKTPNPRTPLIIHFPHIPFANPQSLLTQVASCSAESRPGAPCPTARRRCLKRPPPHRRLPLPLSSLLCSLVDSREQSERSGVRMVRGGVDLERSRSRDPKFHAVRIYT